MSKKSNKDQFMFDFEKKPVVEDKPSISLKPENIFDGKLDSTIKKPSVQKNSFSLHEDCPVQIIKIPSVPLPENLNVVFFSLTTQHLISDFNVVNFSNLKMSAGATYNTLRQEYNIYTVDKIQSLIHELLVADAIIGFNHQNFDYDALSAYMPELALANLRKVKSLDIYLYLHKKLGFRVSLDSVVKATLKTEKTTTGVQAVDWYRQGKIDLITEYCKNDVRVTKELYEFGCEHHFILYADKRTLRDQKVYVDWKIPERFANDNDAIGTN